MRIDGIFRQSGLRSQVTCSSRTERESGCQNPPMMSSLDGDVGDGAPALVLVVEYRTEYTPLLPLFFFLTSKYVGVFGRFLLGIHSSPPRWSSQYSTPLLIVPNHHQSLIICVRPSCHCRVGYSCPCSDPFLFPRACHELYAGPWGQPSEVHS